MASDPAATNSATYARARSGLLEASPERSAGKALLVLGDIACQVACQAVKATGWLGRQDSNLDVHDSRAGRIADTSVTRIQLPLDHFAVEFMHPIRARERSSLRCPVLD